MRVKIQRLNPNLIVPSYAHAEDAGLDLYSLEDKILAPGERYLFKLGFALEIPKGYVGLIWDKSGLAASSGITSLGGVIDSNYRGEVGVVVFNTSKQAIDFKKGDRIAQLLIQPIESVEVEEVKKLSDSPRDTGAWGSTGK